MNFDPNPLFYYMLKLYSEWKNEDKLVICNEGGSRSGKTWDTFHLIVYICWHSETPLSIYVLRKTLTDCRDFTFDEFLKFTQTIGIYDANAYVTSPKPHYKIGNHTIKFRGLDDEKNTEGYPSDIIFLNEALEVMNESLIKGIHMRCERLFIADWNPKFTTHWIFKWEERSNVFFTRTTYKNNKHCPAAVVKELEGYEPTKENIEQGTANEYRYKVYTCGERGSMEGLVFQNVTWHDSITTDTEGYFYGLDFGNTTGIYAFAQGCLNQDGIWFDCPIYGSFATSQEIVVNSNSGLSNFWIALKKWLDDNKMKDTEMFVFSDSAQPRKISDLNKWADIEGYSIRFLPVKKFPGCIKWRIDVINRNRLNLVRRKWIIEEQENYAYKTIHGIQVNEPIDDFNHFWDAAGYSIQYLT